MWHVEKYRANVSGRSANRESMNFRAKFQNCLPHTTFNRCTLAEFRRNRKSNELHGSDTSEEIWESKKCRAKGPPAQAAMAKEPNLTWPKHLLSMLMIWWNENCYETVNGIEQNFEFSRNKLDTEIEMTNEKWLILIHIDSLDLIRLNESIHPVNSSIRRIFNSQIGSN